MNKILNTVFKIQLLNYALGKDSLKKDSLKKIVLNLFVLNQFNLTTQENT